MFDDAALTLTNRCRAAPRTKENGTDDAAP
jgi:hypothetical protein